MEVRIIGFLWLFVFSSFSLSVDAQNPFDLKHRLHQDTVEELIHLEDPSVIEEDDRPLEEQPEVEIGVAEDEFTSVDEKEEEVSEDGLTEAETFSKEIQDEAEVESEVIAPPTITKVPGERPGNNFLLFIFLLVSIIIALVVAVDRSIMDRIYRSLINHNFLNYFIREQKGSTSLQLMFLFIVFLVNMGLFVLFFAREVLLWPGDLW